MATVGFKGIRWRRGCCQDTGVATERHPWWRPDAGAGRTSPQGHATATKQPPDITLGTHVSPRPTDWWT